MGLPKKGGNLQILGKGLVRKRRQCFLESVDTSMHIMMHCSQLCVVYWYIYTDLSVFIFLCRIDVEGCGSVSLPTEATNLVVQHLYKSSWKWRLQNWAAYCPSRILKINNKKITKYCLRNWLLVVKKYHCL